MNRLVNYAAAVLMGFGTVKIAESIVWWKYKRNYITYQDAVVMGTLISFLLVVGYERGDINVIFPTEASHPLLTWWSQ
jgi:hypothetical protein